MLSGLHVVRIQPYGFPIMMDHIVQFSLFHQGTYQVRVPSGIVRGELQDLAIKFDGLVQPALFFQDNAQVVQCLGLGTS